MAAALESRLQSRSPRASSVSSHVYSANAQVIFGNLTKVVPLFKDVVGIRTRSARDQAASAHFRVSAAIPNTTLPISRQHFSAFTGKQRVMHKNKRALRVALRKSNGLKSHKFC